MLTFSGPPLHLEQIYLACLSQASYLIVDDVSKTAVVVDPRRDVDVYLEKAAARGARIRHVLLTHLHADFVAGHIELRERTGASIHLGAGATTEYDFVPMRDGGALDLGSVRLEFLETPGHTPESVSIVVLEGARPKAVLTGDTLFVGDVGRPDLAVAAGMDARAMAGMLYDSLHGKLLVLPDETIVYPGHGAGSSCGKNLSPETASTIGAQRRTNYALQPIPKERFVDLLTAEPSAAPAYFAYDADRNRADRPTLERVLEAARTPLDLDEVLRRVDAGAELLDTREPDAFAAEHVAGAVNVGLSGRYASWVGTMLRPETPIVILADPGQEEESAVRLGRIGFDRIAGHLRGGMEAARGSPVRLVRGVRASSPALAMALAGANPPLVLDVRQPGEWDAGHIEGAVHLPLASLEPRLSELPRDRELVVVCRSGYRSSIAASLLERAGFDRVTDLAGGMEAWVGAQQPVIAGG